MILGPVSLSGGCELLAFTRAGELILCDCQLLKMKKLGDLYVDKWIESLVLLEEEGEVRQIKLEN